MADQKTISLSGSVEMVQEFFEFAINRCAPLRRAPRAQKPRWPHPARSILYQRGIYPPEEFKRVAKYGLSMMVTSDEGLKSRVARRRAAARGAPAEVPPPAGTCRRSCRS